MVVAIFKLFLKNSDRKNQMTSNKVHIKCTLGVSSQQMLFFSNSQKSNEIIKKARNSEFTIRLPLGQIGQGQTPFSSGFMFCV